MNLFEKTVYLDLNDLKGQLYFVKENLKFQMDQKVFEKYGECTDEIGDRFDFPFSNIKNLMEIQLMMDLGDTELLLSDEELNNF